MIDVNQLYEKLVKSGEDWAHKNAAADILEESKKPILSQIMQDYQGSHAAKESLALADPRYTDHLKTMVESRKEANIARVKWEAQKMYVELTRTKAASERAANKEAM